MARYEVRVTVPFEAAHHLTKYHGEPEPSHGHSWRAEAVLETQELDNEGMAFDFVAVQSVVRGLVSRLDHRDINTVPPFDQLSPTTERIAQWLFEEIGRELPSAPLTAVTVWEGASCSATYRP
jgi:6-pyruvoyltetrahydropterin/6-carboxytetrahydropterin synthase